MKLVLNLDKPVKENKRVGNPTLLQDRDPFKIGNHEFYRYLLAKKGIQVRDCHDKPMFESKFQDIRLENPEKTFEFEYVFKYDWLTEYYNLQKLLSNPYKVTGRYKIIDYDEIKRKGFLIISKQLTPGQAGLRLFKGQRVVYYLYNKKKAFPKGAMMVMQKPPEVTIRFDNFQNKIRIEGPNCHPKWQLFNL